MLSSFTGTTVVNNLTTGQSAIGFTNTLLSTTVNYCTSRYYHQRTHTGSGNNSTSRSIQTRKIQRSIDFSNNKFTYLLNNNNTHNRTISISNVLNNGHITSKRYYSFDNVKQQVEQKYTEPQTTKQQQEQQQESTNNDTNQEKGNTNNNTNNIKDKKILSSMIVILSLVSSGVVGYYHDDLTRNISDISYIRNIRVLFTGLAVTFYYKYYLYGIERGDPEFPEKIKIANKLAAEALVELCQKNKGIFIKLAQILASLDHVLPTEYTQALVVFQDHAPFEPFEQVVKLFMEETGKHPDEIYKEFERIPIASASLAQVHRAKLQLENGELVDVAVKVQYPDLTERFEKDIESIYNTMIYINWWFPKFEFSWLLPEATSCLNQELDFINEGRNSERIKELFNGKRQLYIPKVYWNNTTKRILTMEFINGVRIDDKKALTKMGIDFGKLYYLFSEVFAEQIFVFGFLHSDPHSGNILVRRLPNGDPEMVLLDHGLYKQIDENVRINFCHLWKSVCLGDAQETEYYAKQLGAGQYAKHLGVLLNLRPERSRENLKQLVKELGNQTLTAVTDILKNLPKEILLVLKTNNLIRQITTHFRIENGFLLMAKSCIKGIYQRDTLVSSLKYFMTLCIFNITIKVMEWRTKWILYKYGPPPVEPYHPHQYHK